MSRNAALSCDDHEIGNLMNDEQWCVGHLFNLRWPDGFVCPFCGHRERTVQPVRKITCRLCGRLSTVTSGTLLHSSKKQLSLWFKAVWWLIHNVPDLTITLLQKELGFASYQTAWIWMGKLRLALQIFVNEVSSGTVIVGAGSLPGKRGRLEPHHFLMAVESIACGRMTGRVQMARVDSVDALSAAGFIKKHVRPGSTVVLPECLPFTSLTDMAGNLYIIDESECAGTVLDDLIQQFSLWYERKKYRPVNLQLTQGQLNEFCFIQTAHLYPDKCRLFDRLLAAAISYGPVSAECLSGAAQPERGRS
ncbi:MAG: transposase [Desulfofustis sp.]|jgi:hypothetical protein|nr:transposase [Desulfofustis sp.]